MPSPNSTIDAASTGAAPTITPIHKRPVTPNPPAAFATPPVTPVTITLDPPSPGPIPHRRRNQTLRDIESAVAQARAQNTRVEIHFQGACEADPVFARQCAQTAIEAGAAACRFDTPSAPSAPSAIQRDIAAFLNPAAFITGAIASQ